MANDRIGNPALASRLRKVMRGDVLFDPTGSHLVGTRVGSSQIDSFSIGSNGLLRAAADSPSAAQSAGPFGSEFRPTD